MDEKLHSAAPSAEPEAMNLPAQLMRQVVRVSATGCWEWIGHKVGAYGRLTFRGESQLAHRVAYLLSKGTPGTGHVLHTCDNPPCINPEHLFLGDPQVNARDRNAKGRQACGERNGSAKLTREQVFAIRSAVGSAQSLAEQFGVGRETIRLIRNGDAWRNL